MPRLPGAQGAVRPRGPHLSRPRTGIESACSPRATSTSPTPAHSPGLRHPFSTLSLPHAHRCRSARPAPAAISPAPDRAAAAASPASDDDMCEPYFAPDGDVVEVWDGMRESGEWVPTLTMRRGARARALFFVGRPFFVSPPSPPLPLPTPGHVRRLRLPVRRRPPVPGRGWRGAGVRIHAGEARGRFGGGRAGAHLRAPERKKKPPRLDAPPSTLPPSPLSPSLLRPPPTLPRSCAPCANPPGLAPPWTPRPARPPPPRSAGRSATWGPR
jgi:hypothetical protein